jgi:hypothetical protein
MSVHTKEFLTFSTEENHSSFMSVADSGGIDRRQTTDDRREARDLLPDNPIGFLGDSRRQEVVKQAKARML